MQLDPLTLIVLGNLSTVLCGTFLLTAWTQLRARSLLWWAAANLVYPASTLVTMAGVLTDRNGILLSGLLLADVPPVLIWGGTLGFTKGRVSPRTTIAALALVSTITLAAFSLGGNVGAAIANFAIWMGFLTAAGAALWAARHEEPLPARLPLIALFAIHISIYCGGIVDFMTGALHAGIETPRIDTWFGLSYFETILYSMGSAFLMALLSKEREENAYKAAARSDSLTGIANRGSFFEQAERLLNRCHNDKAPLSLIVFDLDRFKSINDAHGHAVGDQVLRAFADTVRGLLRPNDLFGRHGGEEFAVALPGATIQTAYIIAERVRTAFADASHDLLRPFCAMVSAGVATAAPGATFEATMYAADMAMYQAKQLGRNRVERADETTDAHTDPDNHHPKSNVIRVA